MNAPSPVNPLEMRFPDTDYGTRVLVTEQHSFICTQNGSNKYWRAYVGTSADRGRVKPRLVVVLEWGRIGVGDGRREIKVFSGTFGANRYVKSRIEDKIRKGYTRNEQVTSEPTFISQLSNADLPESSYDWDLF